MLASATGYTAAIPLGFFIAANITNSPIQFRMIIGLIVGAVNGAITGVLQWSILRHWISQLNWWVIISVVGFSVGESLGATSFFDQLAFAGIARLTTLGTLVGIAQWLILRRYFPKAGRWIIANTLGWGLGAIIGILVGGSIANILLFPVSGAVAGAITGQALIKMLNETAIQARNRNAADIDSTVS